MAIAKPAGKGLGHVFTTWMSGLHVWLYRISGGRIGVRMFNSPVLLLTTTGNKSGRQRTTPLLYLDTGDGAYVIVGSYGGADKPPAWLTNLLNAPDARIQIGAKTLQIKANIASASQKAELWPRMVAMYPDYQIYQDRTARDIPVIILAQAE